MTLDLPLSLEDVSEIVAILDKTPYERIDIHTNRFHLSVVRSGGGWTQSWAFHSAAPEAVDEDSKAQPREVRRPPVEQELDGVTSIRAPLPGTFYRSPQPGSPPFVDVGGRVAPDTVVGIIETMKLMSPVYAGIAGTVVEVTVENAASVDTDSQLMRVTTADA